MSSATEETDDKVELASLKTRLREAEGHLATLRAVNQDATGQTQTLKSAEQGQAEAKQGQASAEQGQASAERGQASAEQGQASAEQGQASAERGQASAKQGQASAERGLAEAERQGRIKDEFLANLSHEIRTPLNAILGWSQLLTPGKSSEAELAEGLEVITRNARIQARLIDDLLDMSRIISGKMRLEVQRVDLPAVIDAAIESAKPAAEAKKMKLQKVIDPIAGEVTGDPNRLQQVIWNLLSNAIKFTPKGGTIQVVLERCDSLVELSVSDTGNGIAPEFLPFVFDRFSQADTSATRTYKGLGLGLAIVKSLTELHGGSVRVKSGGVDKGTTFIVSLPVSVVHTLDKSENRQHQHTHRQGSHTPDLTGIKVMVVDDESDAIGLVKKIMQGCGAMVKACTSAAECFDFIPTWHPDVLISDIGMPEMDGYTLIEKVRALSPENGGLTPAIALTAFARSEDRREAMLAGFDIHIAKPVEPDELVAVVGRLAHRNMKR